MAEDEVGVEGDSGDPVAGEEFGGLGGWGVGLAIVQIYPRGVEIWERGQGERLVLKYCG